MTSLNRIATFLAVMSLMCISPSAQDKSKQKASEQKPRQVWIRLKSGPIVNGDLVQMDPDSVDFKVKGILQSVPCDDVIGVMFIPPTPRPTPTPSSPSTPTSAPTPTPTPTPTDVERIEPMTASLRPIIYDRPKAVYTDEARNEGIEGTVVLQAVFNADGSITNIRVIRGLPHGLTDNAVEAARKLRFYPAKKDGQTVSVRGSIEYTFNLIRSPITLSSPDNGAVFSHYPRKMTFKWKPYPKAGLYRVRIEQGYPDSSEWSMVHEIEIAETEYVYYFVGAQPGRWRIEAREYGGKSLTVSDWRTFRFTK